MKLFLILFLIALNINLYSQDYYEDRLFIKLKNDYQDNLDLTQDKSINFILSKYDKAKFQKAFRSYEMRSVYEVQFKDKVDLTRLIAQLEKYEYIEYAEKIPIYKLFYTPNDPQYSSQWNLAKIQADQAWNLSQGCSGIKVAITDDGFLMNHEDLVNQWYINSVEIAGNGIDEDGNGYIDDWRGWDAANNDNDPSAFNPSNTYFTHGTHVAGIAGGATNNSLGIASIGFNNKLIPIKIGRDIDGALTGAQQGLDYAINSSGCDVINMSWGGTGVSATFQLLFNLAYSKGIICVAASGNSSMNVGGPYPSPGFYPASYNHVISVAASTNTDTKAGFSNYGTNIDVTAPGANILSCLAGGISSYGNLSGTSMASPLVAGLCGLMKCYNPIPIDSIVACLKRTCGNINAQNPSFIGQVGAGRINAFQALQCLAQKPVSDFYAKDSQQCIGKPVRYFATSFGIPTLTYSWSFPGGSPPTSTFKNPQVTYAANGMYSATLTTTNGVGSHTVTKTNIVTIGAPKASLIGRKYTSYNSNAVIVTVKFTGNPPFNVTLTDGTNNFTQTNITANPYYFSIVPLKDTSYISISSFQDTQCVGTKLGQDTIYKITLGSGSVLCKDSIEINSAQSGWQALQTNGTWGALSASFYCAGAFAANSTFFPGVTATDCLWGPIVETGNRTAYNSSSWTTTSVYSCSFPKLKKQFNLPTGSYIDSVRLWMVSDDFIDTVWVNNKVVYKATNPIHYGQILILGNDINIGNSFDPFNEVIVKSGDNSGCYGTYFRMKVYYSKVCNSVISDCDTTNLNTGLVLNLDFNGNTQDKSGKGNHATNYGATAVAGKLGIANTAYYLNGTSNYMMVPHNSTLNLRSFTMTAILKPNKFRTVDCYSNCIMSKGYGGAPGQWGWQYAPADNGASCFGRDTFLNNHLMCASSCQVSFYIPDTPRMKTNQWECFVVSYDSASQICKVYSNGKLRHQFNTYWDLLNSQNTMPIFIGKIGDPSYIGYLTGVIDDIRVYNRVLAPSEVKGYCGTCSVTTPLSDCDTTNLNTGLVLNLPFNGNTNDVSGNANHATNFGATLATGKAGIANTAYQFNGSTNYMKVFNSSTLGLNSAYTVTCKLKIDGWNTAPCHGNMIFFKGNTSPVAGNQHFDWVYAPNAYNGGCISALDTLHQNLFPGTTTVGSPYSYTPYLQRFKWYCFAAVQKNDTLYNYIDGVMVYKTPNTGTGSNPYDIFIGRSNYPSYPYWLNATIDDIRVYNRSLSSSEVKGYCGTCSVTPPPPPPLFCDTSGLILCMSMDGNTLDSTRYNHHGINRGVTPTIGRNGSANGAYNFNGTTGYITLGVKPMLKPTAASISIWVKPQSFNTYIGGNANCIMLTKNPNNPGSYMEAYSLYLTNRSGPTKYMTVSTHQPTTNEKWYQSNQNTVLNQWTHLVLTFDYDSLKLYINGQLDNKTYKGFNNVYDALDSIMIGYSANTMNKNYFKGDMDELKMYNRVLSATEVNDLYSKPFSCSCNSTVLPPSKPCDTARKFVYLKCTNDILQLNARQGSNYQWLPSIGLSSDTIRNPFCSVKSTTTYLVLYTDTNGCQLIDTVNVMVKKAAFYSPLDDQLICNGDSVQLIIPIKATGIIWSPNTGISNVNSKSPFFSPSSTTTYYLQFIDSLGCSQFDTIVVNVKPCCAARARFKLSNNLVCFGSNIFITNTSKNSTSYNWSFPNATPSSFIGANPPALSFPTGNSYPIRLIVSNGICFDTLIQSVSVVQVKPNAGKDSATCLANLTVNIGETAISDWSYKWTPITYLNDATISNPVCTMINDSVNYILEVTDRSSGCKGYDTVQVKTNQKIDSIVASANICQGESILFNSISINTSGKYFYTIKKLNSICDSFINIQYVKVLLPTSIIQSPEPYCNFYIDKKGKRHDTSYTRRDTIKYKSLITCDSLILTTRVNIFKTKYDSLTKIACKEVIYNGKKYLTSKRKIDSTIIRGSYSGCDSVITHIHAVVKPIPNAQITASKSNLLNYGDTVTLTASGGFTYLWSPTNSTNTSIVHISEDTIYHTYIVTVTDTNLCWDTAMYRVKGRFPDTLYYGIPNIFSPNGDGRNDIFIPNMNYGVKMLEFYIWNRWGEKMWESHDNHGWDGFYKNKPAPASVYVYYVMFQTPWGKREYKGSFTLIR